MEEADRAVLVERKRYNLVQPCSKLAGFTPEMEITRWFVSMRGVLSLIALVRILMPQLSNSSMSKVLIQSALTNAWTCLSLCCYIKYALENNILMPSQSTHRDKQKYCAIKATYYTHATLSGLIMAYEVQFHLHAVHKDFLRLEYTYKVVITIPCRYTAKSQSHFRLYNRIFHQTVDSI